MKRIDKTVFISYRRTNVPWALAIEQHLTHSGFDVFFDFQGIASGDFERTILENIGSRAHFLVLLTPSALERCDDPGDWLRREIEGALETRRNIVPLMLEGFDFSTSAIASKLTGKLAALRRYNGMSVSAEYFDAAMTKLRETFLNVPLDAVLHPASGFAQQAAKDQQAAAATAPAVQKVELTAQDWFEQGFNAADQDEKLRCYSEAIRLKPDYALAYNNRGNARRDKGDLEGAMQDYSEAIRLKPDLRRPTITGELRAAPKAIWMGRSGITTRPSGSSRIMRMPTTTGAMRAETEATSKGRRRITARPSASSPT